MTPRLATVILALVCSTGAASQQLDCRPSDPFAISFRQNPLGTWAAWMCGKRINIVACRTDHCTEEVANAASWVWGRGLKLQDANSALKKYKAGGICDPQVYSVWWHDKWKLQQDFSLSNDYMKTICP